MRNGTQLLLAAIILAPWMIVTARDADRAHRLGQTREATAKIGEIIASVAIYHRADGPEGRRCPHPASRSSAEVGPTPPLDLRCADGPHGLCRPTRTASHKSGPGMYPGEVWSAPMWSAIDFRILGEHAFHYSLETQDRGDACVVSVEANGDLDGDGLRSSFRAGAILQDDRAIITPVWEIDRPLE